MIFFFRCGRKCTGRLQYKPLRSQIDGPTAIKIHESQAVLFDVVAVEQGTLLRRATFGKAMKNMVIQPK